MTTCYVTGCGRVHGLRRDIDLCAYHAADFRAGVALDLRTGYTLWLGEDGLPAYRETAQYDRAFGILDAIEDENAPASLERPRA